MGIGVRNQGIGFRNRLVEVTNRSVGLRNRGVGFIISEAIFAAPGLSFCVK